MVTVLWTAAVYHDNSTDVVGRLNQASSHASPQYNNIIVNRE